MTPGSLRAYHRCCGAAKLISPSPSIWILIPMWLQQHLSSSGLSWISHPTWGIREVPCLSFKATEQAIEKSSTGCLNYLSSPRASRVQVPQCSSRRCWGPSSHRRRCLQRLPRTPSFAVLRYGFDKGSRLWHVCPKRNVSVVKHCEGHGNL